jgi:hypothetical protein
MAMRLLFHNILIPISTLEKKVAPLDVVISWDRPWNTFHDDYLYHEGAMNHEDIEEMLVFWEKKGLNIYKTVDGNKEWDELCVLDTAGFSSIYCDWIDRNAYKENEKYDPYIWLKGKPQGKIIGPFNK